MKLIVLAAVAVLMSSSLAYAAQNCKVEARFARVEVRYLDKNDADSSLDDRKILSVEMGSQPSDPGQTDAKYWAGVAYWKPSAKYASYVQIGDLSFTDAVTLREQMLNPKNHIVIECTNKTDCLIRKITSSNR